MKRLKPEKLHVTYLASTSAEDLVVPRRYTLTHSDRTGNLFLCIGSEYDTKRMSGLYSRLMRDEVLAELGIEEGRPVLRAYCHVSGGFVFGTAGFRYRIFRHELPLVLEAIRYGDRRLFDQNQELSAAAVLIHFRSTASRYDRVEEWGTIDDYS